MTWNSGRHQNYYLSYFGNINYTVTFNFIIVDSLTGSLEGSPGEERNRGNVSRANVKELLSGRVKGI